MIEVRQLKRSFGTQLILNGVDLRIESGESAVIIGRSGGGKSVLLKHLIGLLQPDSGSAAPPSSLTTDLYQLIERIVPQAFPGAIAVPMISTGATDAVSRARSRAIRSSSSLPDTWW